MVVGLSITEEPRSGEINSQVRSAWKKVVT
jgi:hypothetical protein